MPEFASSLAPAEVLNRIESYLRDWKETSSTDSLRALRVFRLSMHEQTGNSFVIRFSIIGNAQMLRYCDCDVIPDGNGSTINYVLRGAWAPFTVGLVVFSLLCVQMLYELFSGTFSWVNPVISVVVPMFAALMAHLDTRMVRTKYDAGMRDAFSRALRETKSSAE